MTATLRDTRDVVLLHTVHGSHLYGLAHEGSDLDTYTVIAGGHRGRQCITDGDDAVLMPLAVFVRQLHCGSPQSLEALFSPIAGPCALDGYRSGFLPDTVRAADTYRRTMKSFALHGAFKRRRHALRLAMNLADLVADGRFNPRLTAAAVAEVTEAARSTPSNFVDHLRGLSPVDPFQGDDGCVALVAATWSEA